MLGRVTVMGCGLIGGSLVKCLRARHSAVCIAAVDRQEVLDAARAFFDAGAVPGSSAARALVADSDLVVFAAPVGAIVRDLASVLDAAGPDAVVTDTGSVKAPVIAAAAGHLKATRFVGGHPMAGREVGGFEASSPDLFSGARWFIVKDPTARGALLAAPHPEAVARVVELAAAAGAEATFIGAEAHDRAMAYVSHAPQILASALYSVAARAGVLAEAGPGFRDVTRIAGGPRAMWRDIIDANRPRIATALEDVLRPLIELRDALLQDGEPGLMAALDLLEEAQAARRTMSALERSPRDTP